MSIPDRLWRVVKGYWSVAEDRLRDAEAEAAAYQELAATLRRPPAEPSADPTTRAIPPSYESPSAPTDLGEPRRTQRGAIDPFQAAYELLGVEPGVSLAALDNAFEARLEEIRPERAPAGSPERAALEARRSAVTAAYDRLRDALNATETRFERLELE